LPITPNCIQHRACSGASVSQEQESSASRRPVFVPIKAASRPSLVLRNHCIRLPLIHAPIFIFPSSAPLTSLLPQPSLLLPSPSRLSDCRPSFIDNHKAQSLFETTAHSLFTSLVGVALFDFSFFTIRLFQPHDLLQP
jgi:hypothetical protein